MAQQGFSGDAAGEGSLIADFEALYQGRAARLGTHGPLMEVIPWQLDGPQPIIVELEAAGEITGPVLECGCGLGDNALFLAGQGHQLTAFDAAPTVIEQDRAKAATAGVAVDFVAAEATTLHGIAGESATVLDSAMLHCLNREQRRAYLAALHRVCQPSARLHILCFTDALAGALPDVGPLDEANLSRDLTGEGWRVERMRPARYTTALTRQAWLDQVPDVLNLFPVDVDSPGSVDAQGRVLLPIWQITAQLW